MKRFYHAILACGVFAAVVAAVSCTKDATGGGGGGYNGEPEVNHDMDGILRRNYLWNEEYATLSPDFGLPYDEFLGDVLEYGEHKIGYLVYASFDAAFDGELLDALQAFKDAGINDLILDLRLNGGGYVMSSRMLASCIAGARCEGQVFQYYRYNDARMEYPEMTAAETGQAYDESKERFYEEFIYGDYRGADLRGYALDLPRLYVIVSSGTASASEAVVNALRGIGLEVVLVGQKTNGKNVGMEGVYLEDGAYEYLFMPVSFQGYNARLETVDPNGLVPDALKGDWNNGYEEFGSLDDPCLEYAVTSITGQSVRSSESAAQRRPGVRLVEGLSLPEISCRPEGMILLPPDAVRKD
jgi:hypothetical protein